MANHTGCAGYRRGVCVHVKSIVQAVQCCAIWSAASCVLAGSPADVTYTYDDLGRLRTGTFNDGRKVDYQYDPAGNRTTLTSGTPPALSIAFSNESPVEGANITFRVTKTGSSSQEITVKCVPTDGTAQSTGSAPYNDYVRATQVIAFPATDPSPTTRNCLVNTNNDSYYEGPQTIVATLQDASAGSTIVGSPATGTVLDDDALPGFSVISDTKTEGGTLSFTINKSGLTEHNAQISYATADVTATLADGDYTSRAGTLTFIATEASQSLFVATASDSKYESNESIALNLGSPIQATIAVGSAPGYINNDDAAPTFLINDPAIVNEGAAITFTVTKSGNASAASHSLNWATADHSAIAASDYTAASGSITFQPAETTKTIQVQTLNDGVTDGSSNETFFVNLTTNGSSNNAAISDSQGIGTIADLQALPSIPLNLTRGSGTGPNYTIGWDASSGPVTYYILEEAYNTGGGFENAAPYTVNVPARSKAFSGRDSGEYYYRVKACSSTNQCSGFSSVIVRQVCNPTCL